MSDGSATGGSRQEHGVLEELSAERLAEERGRRWHQDGTALLTIDAARDWLGRCGLLLYAPRVQALGAPAPTFVEATLGREAAQPEPAELGTARTLLARLVAEGAAVPLNLMGAGGALGSDVPDFIASAPVFSYIFTLRGNKAWKQPPVTAGPVKVSPLALAVYEMLGAKVTLTSYDLATQLGKEVTEGAVLRALTELWGQLRVLPIPQADGTPAQWELATARFSKQIKSGANAGQPTALSALISLYLGQVTAATEDEIESFLSPLAPRSRVRDVLHALLPARQLGTFVIGGKTLLHLAGDLPVAAIAPEAQAPAAEGAADDASAAPRIKTFVPRPSPGSRAFPSKPGGKLGLGLRVRPAGGFNASSAARSGPYKPSFRAGPAPGGERPERARRPFDRAGRPPGRAAGPRSDAKPVFNRPWDEERAAPQPGSEEADGVALSAEAATPRSTPRPRTARPGGSGVGGPRKTFSKPGTFGRKREGTAGRPFAERTPSDNGASRGPRRAPGGEKRSGEGGPGRTGSFAPRTGGPRSGLERPVSGGQGFAGSPRSAEGADAPRKIFRKFDAPRGGAAKPSGRPGAGAKPFGARPFGARPSGARPSGARPSGARPPGSGPTESRDARGPGTPRPRVSGGFGSRDERPGSRPPSRPGARPTSRPGPGPGSGPRPERPSPAAGGSGFAPGRPPSKAAKFAGGGGPFAKFADGKKPFRKPGPGKAASGRPTSSRPASDRPAGSKRASGARSEARRESRPGAPGGFAPTKRRPSGGATE